MLPPKAQAEERIGVMWLRRFFDDEAGTSAIEYGLIAALVSVASITALANTGTSAETLFGTLPPLLNAFQGATGP
jgi:pilus assembly protein Flp/PilA